MRRRSLLRSVLSERHDVAGAQAVPTESTGKCVPAIRPSPDSAPPHREENDTAGMISLFYKTHSRTILWVVALTFPVLLVQGNSLPSNNDIETWLPRDAAIRQTFEQFKRDFGADETILIAFPADGADAELTEALAARLEALPGVKRCWSADRLRTAMRDMEVSEAEIDARLRGFVVSEDGKTLGLVAVLSNEGVQHRLQTVRQIRQELAYCQLGQEIALAGPPVVVAELDRLGNTKNNQKFFIVTLLISLGLLYYSLRNWKVTGAILGITVWAINLTMTLVKLSGGELNFILGALSVMVMVFTLAICVHFLHYYEAASPGSDRIGAALSRAWKPCGLATLTTTVGLLSLMVSDIPAVRTFGLYAALGSVVAMLAGLGLTPAVLTLWPQCLHEEGPADTIFSRTAHWLMDRRLAVSLVTGLLVAASSIGLFRLYSRIEPLDFLPQNNSVLADVNYVEQRLVKLNSIEAVVDFGDDNCPFVEKLRRVRQLEDAFARHPSVDQTISAATFFPRHFPDDAWQSASLLQKAQERWSDSNDYISDGDRLWRISARIASSPDRPRRQIIEELKQKTGKEHVIFTGMSPLLEEAQQSIFNGFWESFLTAFGLITLVMIISLRSLKAGLVAMVPNLTPLCVVFGILGWFSVPVDIGMMMTGSIALGIAVDGTFHFMVHYNTLVRQGTMPALASRGALLQTGAPIFKAAVIAAIGMLALGMSNFVPTARFGYMMATLLLAALLGDLILLPAILALGSGARKQSPLPSVVPEGLPEQPVTLPVPHTTPLPRKPARVNG